MELVSRGAVTGQVSHRVAAHKHSRLAGLLPHQPRPSSVRQPPSCVAAQKVRHSPVLLWLQDLVPRTSTDAALHRTAALLQLLSTPGNPQSVHDASPLVGHGCHVSHAPRCSSQTLMERCCILTWL